MALFRIALTSWCTVVAALVLGSRLASDAGAATYFHDGGVLWATNGTRVSLDYECDGAWDCLRVICNMSRVARILHLIPSDQLSERSCAMRAGVSTIFALRIYRVAAGLAVAACAAQAAYVVAWALARALLLGQRGSRGRCVGRVGVIALLALAKAAVLASFVTYLFAQRQWEARSGGGPPPAVDYWWWGMAGVLLAGVLGEAVEAAASLDPAQRVHPEYAELP